MAVTLQARARASHHHGLQALERDLRVLLLLVGELLLLRLGHHFRAPRGHVVGHALEPVQRVEIAVLPEQRQDVHEAQREAVVGEGRLCARQVHAR